MIIFNSVVIELERPFSSRSFFESGRGMSAFFSGKWKSMDDSAEPLQQNVQLVAHPVGSYKQATLRQRILHRMAGLQIEHLAEYATYLREHPAEINMLYQQIL